MKHVFALLIAFLIAGTALAQQCSYRDRLYYTCKIWGFVKYFHSEVSTCRVDWDNVLAQTLPAVKAAATTDQFNDGIASMLHAAGPMKIAATPFPDTLATELKRNRDFGWFNDPIIRSDVRGILDTIRQNFRPHAICHVKYLGTPSWLDFPGDNPVIDADLSVDYPAESHRLAGLFTYWNIIAYFNPYNDILDAPWDSTLAAHVLSFAEASGYEEFYLAFKRITAQLCDAHVDGTTYSTRYPLPEAYSPHLILRYTPDGYVVVKSAYPEIERGDVVTSVDGKAMALWEDSLRQYISAGNTSVFRRLVCSRILRGPSASTVRVGYRDDAGTGREFSMTRDSSVGTAWFYYYPNDTLATVKWKRWQCNVGYVHMGNLTTNDVDAMYRDLKSTSAIIFDIRNYPLGTIGLIAALMFPERRVVARMTVSDLTYPGTFSWASPSAGSEVNPNFYRGRVIILCNQQTISHAEYTCMILKAMPGAVLVGSQTTGADGNVSAFNFSRDIRTGFTSVGVYYPDGTPTQRVGLVPDSIVYPTAAGIRQGRDEVLEKALQIAGCPVTGGVGRPPENAPEPLSLAQNYPNPFTESTEIVVAPSPGRDVRCIVYDRLGRTLLDLSEGLSAHGRLVVHGSQLPSGGVYVYRITAGDRSATRMMTFVR